MSAKLRGIRKLLCFSQVILWQYLFFKDVKLQATKNYWSVGYSFITHSFTGSCLPAVLCCGENLCQMRVSILRNLCVHILLCALCIYRSIAKWWCYQEQLSISPGLCSPPSPQAAGRTEEMASVEWEDKLFCKSMIFLCLVLCFCLIPTELCPGRLSASFGKGGN